MHVFSRNRQGRCRRRCKENITACSSSSNSNDWFIDFYQRNTVVSVLYHGARDATAQFRQLKLLGGSLVVCGSGALHQWFTIHTKYVTKWWPVQPWQTRRPSTRWQPTDSSSGVRLTTARTFRRFLHRAERRSIDQCWTFVHDYSTTTTPVNVLIVFELSFSSTLSDC